MIPPASPIFARRLAVIVGHSWYDQRTWIDKASSPIVAIA
jgi:hypothetical protein